MSRIDPAEMERRREAQLAALRAANPDADFTQDGRTPDPPLTCVDCPGATVG